MHLKKLVLINKQEKRIKELEQIYGISKGNNQYDESRNNFVTPKTESDLAKEIGISVDTLQNYKKLTEMIPELDELVTTGIITKDTALTIIKKHKLIISAFEK